MLHFFPFYTNESREISIYSCQNILNSHKSSAMILQKRIKNQGGEYTVNLLTLSNLGYHMEDTYRWEGKSYIKHSTNYLKSEG